MTRYGKIEKWEEMGMSVFLWVRMFKQPITRCHWQHQKWQTIVGRSRKKKTKIKEPIALYEPVGLDKQ